MQGISLESPGVVGFLDIEDQLVPGKTHTKVFEIGYSITIGQGNYYRTKVITFSPRYIIVNNVGLKVECKQRDMPSNSSRFVLQDKERLPWHWPSGEHARELCIKLEESDWSFGFPLDHLGDFAIKIPLNDANNFDIPYYLARIQIKIDNSTLFVIINAENKVFPPYRIENLTHETLLISQTHVGTVQKISPFQALPFTWDHPSRFQKLLVEIENGKFKKEYSLDIMKTHKLVTVTTQVRYHLKERK